MLFDSVNWSKKYQKSVSYDFDLVLFWLTLGLLGLGVVMVYSSSIAIADNSVLVGGSPYRFLIRHLFSLSIGLMLTLLATQIPLRYWEAMAPVLFVIGLVMLVAVLIPWIGHEANGSRRWFRFAGFSFQPSELMKFAAVIYAADYTIRKGLHMSSFKRGFLPLFSVMVLTGTLLLCEPDFGAFVVITAIAMGVLFLGGMNWKLFAVLTLLLFVAFVGLVNMADYRQARLFGFLNPFEDPLNTGYQLTHSLMAFGLGGLFGVGLGDSIQKLHYLPEPHTDFILAVIGEEMGFIGVAVTVAAFGWLTLRMIIIGNQAARLERYFAALVAQGVAIWIGVQALINMGVNVGALPTKGLTLPLLSFGGSGLMMNCLAIGVIFRIDYENRALMKGINL
ncbi:MAG: putative lipid II flippase FtsW [Burkholderiales bacterium]|jgi:cell division protein FtsW|nr:putative lipid II flippase FtsW [Burkholderiales bacterium]